MTTTDTNPVTAVVRTEARLFVREPGAMFWILAFPVVLLTILGLIPAFREPDASLGGRRVIDLYVPTVVLLSMIVAGIQTMPAVLSSYRERGILRRLSVTPVRPVTILLAQIVVHAVAVAGAVVLALLVGRGVFGVAFPEQPWGYVLAVFLTLAAALSMGAAIAAVSGTTRIAQTIGTLTEPSVVFSCFSIVPFGLLRSVVTVSVTALIFIVVLCLFVIGDGLRDAFDPRSVD